MSLEPTDDLENQSFDLFTPEDFEGLYLPEVLPKYTGEGRTSFAAGKEGNEYDNQKIEYMEKSLGIKIPEEFFTPAGEIEPDSRALLVTMFIVAGHVLAAESIRRSIAASEESNSKKKEIFTNILVNRSNQIWSERLDVYGMRERLLDGTTVESHYADLGISANPMKKVSEEELQGITRYVFSQLSGEKIDWLDME